jgi:hypothetical protein
VKNFVLRHRFCLCSVVGCSIKDSHSTITMFLIVVLQEIFEKLYVHDSVTIPNFSCLTPMIN